jgi:hypothetical protein
MASAQQRAAWEALVDDVANADEEDLLDVHNGAAPVVPAAVVASCRDRFRDSGFEPMLSREDMFHAKPAKSHQSGAFVKDVRREETDFYQALLQVLQSNRAPEMPEAPDFAPIIIVPEVSTAVVQKANVQRFLQHGEFRSVEALREAGDPLAQSLITARDTEVYVEPQMYATGLKSVRVAFRRFQIVDDPMKIKNWDHVCACFVTGHEWQFQNWFPKKHAMRDPANLFDQVRGFFPYYEESKLPDTIKQWRVVPMLVTRKDTKLHSSIRVAATFWEELYAFLDAHPYFRRFTIAPVK